MLKSINKFNDVCISFTRFHNLDLMLDEFFHSCMFNLFLLDHFDSDCFSISLVVGFIYSCITSLSYSLENTEWSYFLAC